MEIGQKMKNDTRTRQEWDKHKNGHEEKEGMGQTRKWTRGQNRNKTNVKMDKRTR